MSETQNSLYAALAALQGELPHIDKGNTGGGDTKDGKKGPKYKYADLADVSQAILPLLAKHGLAFNSKPTMVDGEFGLSYKLVHKSGEKDEGFVPFGRTGSPQQTGSLITYYRRYTLCAITGAAPDEDDDGAAAEAPYRQSAGDVFEKAAPTAKPRHAERMASVPADDPWYGDAPPATDGSEAKQAQPRPRVTRPEATETDQVWLDLMGQEIAQIKTREDGTKAWASIAAAFKGNTCSAADRKALEALVAGRVSEVVSQEKSAA